MNSAINYEQLLKMMIKLMDQQAKVEREQSKLHDMIGNTKYYIGQASIRDGRKRKEG